MGSVFPLALQSQLLFHLRVGVGSLVFHSCQKTNPQSHSSVGGPSGSSVINGPSAVSKLVSSCPHLNVFIGGIQVSCLVDTGLMVSTITESCFLQYFEPWGQERLRTCHWLQLTAANGLAIPYVGYMKLDIELCGKLVPKGLGGS